jgi:hypothetical protein
MNLLSLFSLKTTGLVLFSPAIVLIIGGCASIPMPLSIVGPDPTSRAVSRPKGYLRVFSATEKAPLAAGDDALDYTFPLNLHMGYEVTDEFGKCVKYVANRMTDMDEWPDQVTLPAGKYRIVAHSTWCGLVSVPVDIERGKTTVIHLDGDCWRPSEKTAAKQLVFLPNGEVVGWRGETTQ